jgi:DNA phosphorothioation-dependent restriction protein DptG
VPEKFKYLEKFMDEIGDWLESKRKEFCVEIYRQLEEEYEDSTSDKAVINAVNSNEYEFLEDGRLIDFPQS